MTIPIIDLFAGPGGLGEGFSGCKGAPFDIAVSVEKDSMAHETLRLRAAHRVLTRSLGLSSDVWMEWDTVIAESNWSAVFSELCASPSQDIREACLRADQEAKCLELGPDSRSHVRSVITNALGTLGRSPGAHREFVLVGGPPCQAYSVVGRSRNRGKQGYRPESDGRHFLYREYLEVIAAFQPAVFVMENVKGILTSRVNGNPIFQSIVDDLRHPGRAAGHGATDLEYELVPLAKRSVLSDCLSPDDFIIKAEDYGVPQSRHRVVIVGIRRDVVSRGGMPPLLVPSAGRQTTGDAIGDLPRLRPSLSFRGEGSDWRDALASDLALAAVAELHSFGGVWAEVGQRMRATSDLLVSRSRDPGSGADRVWRDEVRPAGRGSHLLSWYRDRPTRLVANHESRSHMPSDLVRYLFASCFGAVTGESPRLADFPRCLLPEHRNVDRDDPGAAIFKDRFRVQLRGRPSTTVTSHVAKDGHAFIHPDPRQCRALTVREAARLQTFPDSYVFLGSRTSQFTQVGNAVPPLLARQIAESVAALLHKAAIK